MRHAALRTLVLASAFASLASTNPVDAKCGSHSLDQAGVCSGPRFEAGETTPRVKASDFARDPYAYTRADTTNYVPIVRAIYTAVVGLEPGQRVTRYYTMRMEGGWNRAKVERDIRARYGAREQGEVVVGPVGTEAERTRRDDPRTRGGHERP